MNSRIAKASSAFARMRTNVWELKRITTATKLKVYSAIVLPSILLACESWTVYKRHAQHLNHFHTARVRRIMRIKWQGKEPETDVFSHSNQQSIYPLLMRAQIQWAGHIAPMLDERIPQVCDPCSRAFRAKIGSLATSGLPLPSLSILS